MVKCSTSLWSADLTNLESDIKRVAPHSECFHLDVADGHYAPTMLFFPDLVAQLRPHTSLPMEVHLMTTDPLAWIDPFVEAGVDRVIFCYNSLEDLGAALAAVEKHGKKVGVSLEIREPLDLLEDFWLDLDLITVIGTDVGVKGAEMDASIPAKIKSAKEWISKAGAQTEVQADGGIRRHTVPLLAAAGVDWIVPGSLMFKEDPPEMRQWLDALPTP